MPKLPTRPIKKGGGNDKTEGERPTPMNFAEMFKALEKRVQVLEQWRAAGNAASPRKKVPEPDPEDDEEPEDIPGFTKQADGALAIDPVAIPRWTEAQMIAVGDALDIDLHEHKGQPREVRRLLYEALEEYPQFKGLTAKEEKARPKARQATMPLDIPMGKDGLPKTSPIIGKVTDTHVERDDWKVKGKFLTLHKLAEQFRRDVVEEGKWVCEGFNCHDCVEELGSMNRPVYCHQSMELETLLPKGTAKLTTDESPEDEEPWAEELPAYAEEHERDE